MNTAVNRAFARLAEKSALVVNLVGIFISVIFKLCPRVFKFGKGNMEERKRFYIRKREIISARAQLSERLRSAKRSSAQSGQIRQARCVTQAVLSGRVTAGQDSR